MKRIALLFAVLPLFAHAADVKISALPAGTTLAGTEAMPAVQSAATVKTTPAAINTYVATQAAAASPTNTGVPTYSLAEPRLKFSETDAATDKKLWDFDLNGSNLCLRTRTDADGAGQNAICTLRGTTTSLTSITLGNATLGSVLTLDTGGGSWICDTDCFMLAALLSFETTSSDIQFVSAAGLSLDGASTATMTAGTLLDLTAGSDASLTAGGADGDVTITTAGAGTVDVAGAAISRGTKFTASGCSNGTTLGGVQAGSFVSGTTGACTVTITFPAAPNGWSCQASNLTTTANPIVQTTRSTTTCIISGTTVTGDVIVFQALGY